MNPFGSLHNRVERQDDTQRHPVTPPTHYRNGRLTMRYYEETCESVKSDARQALKTNMPILMRLAAQHDIPAPGEAIKRAIPEPNALSIGDWHDVKRTAWNNATLIAYLYPELDAAKRDAFLEGLPYELTCDCDVNSPGDWGFYRNNGGALVLHRFCPHCGERSRKPKSTSTLTRTELAGCYLWEEREPRRYTQTDVQPKANRANGKPPRRVPLPTESPEEPLREDERQREILKSVIAGIHHTTGRDYAATTNALYEELCRKKGVMMPSLYVEKQTAIQTITEKGWLLDLIELAVNRYLSAERNTPQSERLEYV